MQIHQLNNYRGNLDGSAYLAIDDGNDTGKMSAEDFLSEVNEEIERATEDLNTRIDNIIGGGDAPSAAEITDARLGADGITYGTLGAAIRGQVDELSTDISEANEGSFSFPVKDFTRGQIENGVDGTYYQNRIKLSAIHNSGDRYLIFKSTDPAYSTRFTLYDSEGTYVSQTGFIQRFVIGPNQNYRLNIRRDADTDADHSTSADIALLSSKLVANTVLFDDVQDAYKGELLTTLLDYDIEMGQINGRGENDDGEYNKTRKMRTVGYLFAKKGDIVKTNNTALRFNVFYYGMGQVYKSNTGWQTLQHEINETGYIRVQFGKISDTQLEENLKLTYREAISVSGNVNVALENVQLDLFESGSQNRQFSYDGEKIDVSKYGYDLEALWNFVNPTTAGSFSRQASAYCKGIVFKCLNPDLIQLYNFEDGSYITEFPAASGHGNSIDFSNEYYNASDEFPLAYISSDQTPANVYVNRITRSGSTLIRTLTFPAAKTGYYANHSLDVVNNVIYMMGYKNEDYQTTANDNHMIVTKWDLSDLTDNGDGTYTPEFISEFVLPFIDTTQGRAFLNGKMFVMSSNPYVSTAGKHTKIYVIDVGGERISNILTDFWERIRDHEGEGVFFVPNGEKFNLVADIQANGLFRITL